MQYFTSKLQFSIKIIAESLANQFEEMTVLIIANNKQEAYDKAMLLGKSNEDEFVNNNHNKVLWQFEGITHLFQIPEPNHGTILFSELKDDYSEDQLLVLRQRITQHHENAKNRMASN